MTKFNMDMATKVGMAFATIGIGLIYAGQQEVVPALVAQWGGWLVVVVGILALFNAFK